MKWSWRIGRIAGIYVFFHWTFLLLIGWILASCIATGQAWIAASSGVAFILALFACVVANELGHALAAKRFGVPNARSLMKIVLLLSITLWFWLSAGSRLGLADTFGSDSNTFGVEFVTIGQPGNLPDLTGNPRPVGQVDYVYDIAKHEISRAMVDAANAVGSLEISLDPMRIVNGGPRSDMPATGISWNEAARFVNWLNVSKGYPEAYKFLAQPGEPGYHVNANQTLWQPTDLGFDDENWFRNSGARYVLPSVDEWYKAAYYNPDAGPGDHLYFNFPTGSNDPPTPVAFGTDPDTAVYRQRPVQGPADITQAGGLSAFGAMAMGGNVWEWEETELDLVNDTPYSIRGVRGGRWVNAPGDIWGFSRDDDDFPNFEMLSQGFRVGRLPERTAQLDFEVSPGVGRLQHSGDNLLLVEEIQDGYRVRVLQSAPEFGDRPPFPIPDFRDDPRITVSWAAEEDQWYRFEATVRSAASSVESNGEEFVAPLESTQGLAFGLEILPPSAGLDLFEVSWPFPLNPELGDVSITWEFTAVPIDPPIAGDANADGIVDASDMIALDDHFGMEGGSWRGGDFNLDGTTDFEDFKILARNRTASLGVVAEVAEPSTFRLISSALLCASLLRAFGRR